MFCRVFCFLCVLFTCACVRESSSTEKITRGNRSSCGCERGHAKATTNPAPHASRSFPSLVLYALRVLFFGLRASADSRTTHPCVHAALMKPLAAACVSSESHGSRSTPFFSKFSWCFRLTLNLLSNLGFCRVGRYTDIVPAKQRICITT